ncbi:MAG TPA: Signal transduction histidine kinase [Deltaproteobacteria bacterium]|nr:Signal transduction histidine kinase [Deltaproteobacteria bacterium]
MKIRTLFLTVVVLAVAAFAALNWQEFMKPTTLSLGVATVQAPLGLVMLGLLAFLAALFLVFVIYLQATVLLDARHHAREAEANRKLADQAESSRFTELRRFLEGELKGLAAIHTETTEATKARLEDLDRSLRAAIEESGNTLTAYFGELEDRLEKTAQRQNPTSPD